MEWVPALKLLVLQAAVRVFPAPLKATPAQPAIDVPPSVKFTLPVGFVPVTVAVKVTGAPTVAGLAELASVVPAGVTPCDKEELVEPPLLASPP